MASLHEASLHKLRPTQLTVGMIEVHDKQKHLESLDPAAQRDFMAAHPIPAVKGPGDQLFITDHHHLARAAQDAGVESGFFQVEADFSAYDEGRFWPEMDKHAWVHPLDRHGVRHYYTLIPKHVSQLEDDVYRSLAGYVRNAGGYDKTPTAFAEFVWADFFRRSIPVEAVQADFSEAVTQGCALALSDQAKGLPGYRGK